MPNKPNSKNKDDIKLTITAIAFTIALAMWNYLSGAARRPVQTADALTTDAPTTDAPTTSLQPTVAQMTPVKILLGGPAPATNTVVTLAGPTPTITTVVTQPSVAQPQPTIRAPKRPKPVARTGSSKP